MSAEGYFARARGPEGTDTRQRGRLNAEGGRCVGAAKVRAQLAQADALDRLVWLLDEALDRPRAGDQAGGTPCSAGLPERLHAAYRAAVGTCCDAGAGS